MQTILGLKKEFIDSGWWDIGQNTTHPRVCGL